MSKPELKYEFFQLYRDKQRLTQTNENQFNTQVSFTDGKLLVEFISYYNKIKDDDNLYHIVHNVTLYKNDLDKTSYSGKFFSKTKIPEITTAFDLLVKLFDKVTTTDLINNTTNYNKMLKGTFSTKVYETKVGMSDSKQNLKISTDQIVTITTTVLGAFL